MKGRGIDHRFNQYNHSMNVHISMLVLVALQRNIGIIGLRGHANWTCLESSIIGAMQCATSVLHAIVRLALTDGLQCSIVVRYPFPTTACDKQCDQTTNEQQCDNAANNAANQSGVVVGRLSIGRGGRSRDSSCCIRRRRRLRLCRGCGYPLRRGCGYPLSRSRRCLLHCACAQGRPRRCWLVHINSC
jgi:hypothetical protein